MYMSYGVQVVCLPVCVCVGWTLALMIEERLKYDVDIIEKKWNEKVKKIG